MGFATFQEFMDHAHVKDKETAYGIYDIIKTDYALSSTKVGEYEMCFWIAKEDMRTRPGFWMITIDDNRTKLRTAFYYANLQIGCKENIKFSKGALINMKGNK